MNAVIKTISIRCISFSYLFMMWVFNENLLSQFHRRMEHHCCFQIFWTGCYAKLTNIFVEQIFFFPAWNFIIVIKLQSLHCKYISTAHVLLQFSTLLFLHGFKLHFSFWILNNKHTLLFNKNRSTERLSSVCLKVNTMHN